VLGAVPSSTGVSQDAHAGIVSPAKAPLPAHPGPAGLVVLRSHGWIIYCRWKNRMASARSSKGVT